MAVNSAHPQYSIFLNDWEQMRDTYKGERTVKERGLRYLPASDGMIQDGMSKATDLGQKRYDAYRMRAVFHDYVKDAVEYYIGLMFSKPPAFELPDAMKPMLEKATQDGADMEGLLRRINEQQLVTGRLGILADMPVGPTIERVVPYIELYPAEKVLNWDYGAFGQVQEKTLNLVVLNESDYQRDSDFLWRMVNKYRVLVKGDLVVDEQGNSGTYAQYQVIGDQSTFDSSKPIVPSIRGRTSTAIPFRIINTKDLAPDPDNPPLLGLSNLALAIYRGEADYRQNLFMQGQDTLVVIGGKDDDEIRTGAGATITLRAQPGADAKYIGVESDGLAEQEKALSNDKLQAGNKSGQLTDMRSAQKESGQALNTRVAAQSASLNQMVRTGAAGLEALLKDVATWMGLNPDQVKVTPNLEFTDEVFTPDDLNKLMTAKNLGAPLSRESVHELLVDKGYTKMKYEDELAKIEEEEPIGTGSFPSLNPLMLPDNTSVPPKKPAAPGKANGPKPPAK